MLYLKLLTLGLILVCCALAGVRSQESVNYPDILKASRYSGLSFEGEELDLSRLLTPMNKSVSVVGLLTRSPWLLKGRIL